MSDEVWYSRQGRGILVLEGDLYDGAKVIVACEGASRSMHLYEIAQREE